MRRKNWLASTGLRSVKDLARDDQGTVFVYFTVLAAVLFGLAGLSVDMGRLVSTNTQAKSAADASALAAATAMAAAVRASGADPSNPQPVIAAVWQAAQQGVTNRQNFATVTNGGSTTTGGTVQITNVRLLTSLPELNGGSSSASVDAYVTGDPWKAHFVEVTTETLTQTNFFMAAVGGTPTANTQARAVAGFNQVVCNIIPLWICNPAEANGAGSVFTTADWRGREALVKSDSTWAPGNFGLLDGPYGQGAKEVAETLAMVAPNTCFKSGGVDLRPGKANSVRTSLNTRFDIYENPHFGKAEGDPNFRPAVNVTKGRVWTGNGANKCSKFSEPGPPTAMGFPRDPDLSTSNRFGNGQWDCAQYWSVNHTGTPPAGCTATSTMTRYEMYRYEIQNNKIPNNSAKGGENGNPTCYKGATPPSDTPDRRIIYFAILNCLQHSLNGNQSNVPVAAFGKGFLPEKVQSDDDFVFEIIDVVRPGADDGVLHEIVQLYR